MKMNTEDAVATQARAIPAPVAQNSIGSPPGLIGQLIALITQPAAFFRHMPYTRQWLWVAVLILIVFGVAATSQVQSGATSTETASTTGFDLSLLQDETTTVDTSATAATTATADTNTTLMTALLAASGVLAMWGGQAALLCLIPMLRSHPPNLARALQVAVWASLPLALMLLLRQLYFMAGGTGGTIGLYALLEGWDGYAALPEIFQRILAVFTSNLTFYWLWSMALLYAGARYALNGRRWSAILVLAMWIAVTSVVPAVFGDPVTSTAPLANAAVEQAVAPSTNGSATTTTQQGMGGMFSGGTPPDGGGGMPPSGMPGR